MGIFAAITREINYLSNAGRMLRAIKSIDPKSPNLATDDIESTIEKYPGNIAFIEGDRQWSYAQFDAYANQVAHWAKGNGLSRGDAVAIFVRNRLEYVALWFGLSKIGVIGALINYQLRGSALSHCISVAKAQTVIVDNDLTDAWESAAGDLPATVRAWQAFAPASDFDSAVAAMPKSRVDAAARAGLVGGDTMLNLFTSGTTGLPKAAKLSHSKVQQMMRGFCAAAKGQPTDRTMIVLPLYHGTGGTCGVGIGLMSGGALIIEPSFSVSTFWQTARRHKATVLMYVGELCGFLLSAPETSDDKNHDLRLIFGNGLRKETWLKFTERFAIKQVIEFYGATEGNISFFNIGGPAGSVGRIPSYMSKKFNAALLSYDVETGEHYRGPDGFFEQAETNEVGELIGEIRTDSARFTYEGYINREATNKKILRNVFLRGDMWFRTGDLLKRDEHGFYYFVDRVGDTYRWKAENVSTGEVAGALLKFDGIEQANVYGVEVPTYGGRAGMAALVAKPDLDLVKLAKHLRDALPPFARPIFLRISEDGETTSTFKYKKTNLVKQGYDPKIVTDNLYYYNTNFDAFMPLTFTIFTKITAGTVKF